MTPTQSFLRMVKRLSESSRNAGYLLGVRAGDPFVVDNGTRLQSIGWCVLAAELLHLPVGAIARWMSTPEQPFDLNLRYSFTPWIAVLLLFVLARVFEHGARMREDIEGTV